MLARCKSFNYPSASWTIVQFVEFRCELTQRPTLDDESRKTARRKLLVVWSLSSTSDSSNAECRMMVSIAFWCESKLQSNCAFLPWEALLCVAVETTDGWMDVCMSWCLLTWITRSFTGEIRQTQWKVLGLFLLPLSVFRSNVDPSSTDSPKSER